MPQALDHQGCLRLFSRIVGSLGLVAALAVGVGAGEVKLASQPTLSPDGSRLVFAWQGDLWMVNGTGGRARRLTFSDAQESQPKFSPDGQRIAFVSNRTGSEQVFVMPVAGGTPEQLTFHTGGFSLEQWLDDGENLLVKASRDHFWRRPDRLFLLPVKANAKPKLLFDDYATWGRVSKDGKRLVFTREGTQWWRKEYRGSQSSQVWTFELETGEFKPQVMEETAGREPLWLADGKTILFVSNRTGDFQLWKLDTETGAQSQLTEFGDDSIVQPTISSNGEVVVFRHLFDFYRFEPGSGERPKKLRIVVKSDDEPDPQVRDWVSSATQASFTQDGLEIAMIAGGDLWVMDTELREPRRVTASAELESDPVFSADGNQVYFVSESEGQSDIWSAKRQDESKYWWLNDKFQLARLTNDSEVESGLKLSPDGKSLAYIKGRGDLWIRQLEDGSERRILESWNAPSFDFSSDSRWITYSVSDNDFNRDVWILGLADGAKPVNVSRHPDNEGAPVWSPDGRIIAFTGRRIGTEVDIYFVYVAKEQDETTSRDRQLKAAIEKMQKQRKTQAAPPASGQAKEETKEAAAVAADGAANKGEDEESPGKKLNAEPEEKGLVLDLEDIHLRLRRVSIPDTSEGSLFWSPDSKTLAFSAAVDGQRGIYTIKPDESLKPTLLTTTVGSGPVWLKEGNQIVWLVNGVPSSLNAASKQNKSYGFRVRHDYDRRDKYQAAFAMSWRAMRDNFYDGNLNHRNWDEIRRKYEPMARESTDVATLATVINLMLGELNGSHLGFYPGGRRSGGAPSSTSEGWNEETAHLGLRFEEGFKGPGLKVRDVIHGSPADLDRSRIEAGEIILAVNGQQVDPGMNLPDVLNGSLDQVYLLKVQGAEGDLREVALTPISYGAARSLLYEHWIRQNQKWVDENSDGKLGYMHIQGMNMTSFYRFEQDLYAVGAGKEGLIIDVRENGGGSTTDHLLTALTQPVHAITQPRGGGEGYPHDRKIYASWNKPIIVLCNQNSFSNAEIFSHAIKSLGRGQVVGVPTAGGVISTGGTSIMDLGFLRMPFRGWYLVDDGEDMELNGAVPHHVLWPQPGQMPAGKDIQLEKATAELMKDVEKWQAKKRPALLKASDREGRPRR